MNRDPIQVDEEPWPDIPVEMLDDRPNDRRWFTLIAIAVIIVCVVIAIAWWGD